MAKIFQYIAVTLAVVVLLDRFSSLIAMQLFERTTSGQSGGTINYAIEHKEDLDFLILGSSRAKNSLDPNSFSFLGKGYNLGINGSKPLNVLLVLDILLSRGARPKTLIVQADLFELGKDNRDDTIEQLKRVYPYDTPLIRSYVKEMGAVEEFKYSFGLYRFNRKLLNIAFNFFKHPKEDTGYVGLPSSPEKLDTTPLFQTYAYAPESLDAHALFRIGELAKEHNIRLILLFPPTYQNVGYNPDEQRKLNDDLRNHGISTIIDFSDIRSVPDLVKEENWRDSFHLSNAGAERFSQYVAAELRHP